MNTTTDLILTRAAYDALLPFSSRAAQAAYQRADRRWDTQAVRIKFASAEDRRAFASTCGLSLPMHVAHGPLSCRKDCPWNQAR